MAIPNMDALIALRDAIETQRDECTAAHNKLVHELVDIVVNLGLEIVRLKKRVEFLENEGADK